LNPNTTWNQYGDAIVFMNGASGMLHSSSPHNNRRYVFFLTLQISGVFFNGGGVWNQYGTITLPNIDSYNGTKYLFNLIKKQPEILTRVVGNQRSLSAPDQVSLILVVGSGINMAQALSQTQDLIQVGTHSTHQLLFVYIGVGDTGVAFNTGGIWNQNAPFAITFDATPTTIGGAGNPLPLFPSFSLFSSSADNIYHQQVSTF